MNKSTNMFATLLLFAANPAFANVHDFKTCRNTLPPAAREIADRVVIQLKPGVDAKKIMKSTVIDMVKKGEIERASARQSALTAANCLKKLKS